MIAYKNDGEALWFAYQTISNGECHCMQGGLNATCGRHPYMVSLRNSVNNHVCGAILVLPQWILTAAHCVDPNDTESAGIKPIIVIGACKQYDVENENGLVEVFLQPCQGLQRDRTELVWLYYRIFSDENAKMNFWSSLRESPKFSPVQTRNGVNQQSGGYHSPRICSFLHF